MFQDGGSIDSKAKLDDLAGGNVHASAGGSAFVPNFGGDITPGYSVG